MKQFRRAVLDLFDYGYIDVLDKDYDINDLPFEQRWELCRAYVDDPTTDGDDTEWLIEGDQTASDIYLQSHYLSTTDLKEALDQLFVNWYWPIIHDRVEEIINTNQEEEFWNMDLSWSIKQRLLADRANA